MCLRGQEARMIASRRAYTSYHVEPTCLVSVRRRAAGVKRERDALSLADHII